MRPSLRQVLFRSTAGLDLNFAGGVFSLNNTRTASPAAIPGWSFSRTDTNGTATALDLAGNVIQFSTGVPRITNRGILVEEARTNLLPWSENASSGMSFNGGATFTANTGTSPAGTTTADTLALTSIGYAYAPTAAGQAVGTYTGSVWLRADAPTTVAIRLTRATLGANQTVLTASVTTSWQRFSLSLLTTGVDTLQFGLDQRTVVGGPGTAATVEIWGAQLELGAFATSPIITTGAAGTRGADAVTMGSFVFSAAYTCVVETQAPVLQTGLFPTSFSSTGTNVGLLVTGSTNVSGANMGNATFNDVYGSAVSAGGTIKNAFRAETNNARGCLNGTLSALDATFTPVVGSQTLNIGAANGSTSYWNSYVQRIRVLPFAATDAQLQALTAP